MDETAKALWNEIQSQGIHLDVWAYVFIAGISMLTAVVTSYVTNYFRKRAEEDVIERYFYKTLERLAQTTKTTKAIEEEIRQRFKFLERQINEFYSPLLCHLKYIRTLGQIRVEIENAANPDSLQEYNKAPEFYDNRYTYDNDQNTAIILPSYEKMLSIVTEKYWLAEHSTKGLYQEFCKFVEIWRRFKSEIGLPGDVIEKLDQRKDILERLEADLIKHLDSLTSILAQKNSDVSKPD